MAQHVDRPGVEVLGVRLEIADVRLGVPAGPVQQHQDRLPRLPGVQVAGASSPASRYPCENGTPWRSLQMLSNSATNYLSACDYVILFLWVQCVLISLINVHYV